MSVIKQSGEDYLETILILKNRKGEVRSVDIAREMNLSKPSVCRAVRILKENELITIDENGFITLTESGKKRAESIYERHVILTGWLTSIGVSEKTAAKDACRIEHDISDESFEKLKEHLRLYHIKRKSKSK